MIYFNQRAENESVCNEVAWLQKLDKLARVWRGILLFAYLYLSDIWNILPMYYVGILWTLDHKKIFWCWVKCCIKHTHTLEGKRLQICRH